MHIVCVEILPRNPDAPKHAKSFRFHLLIPSIQGGRPETPVQTPSEKVKFEKKVMNCVVSRGRGSFPDCEYFAKIWNNDDDRDTRTYGTSC